MNFNKKSCHFVFCNTRPCSENRVKIRLWFKSGRTMEERAIPLLIMKERDLQTEKREHQCQKSHSSKLKPKNSCSAVSCCCRKRHLLKRKNLHMKSDHEQVDIFLKLLKCCSDSFLSMSELMDSVEVMVLELDSKLVSQGEHIHPETTEV